MATTQVRVDGNLKTAREALFISLGLDTSTAVKIFLAAALENDGIPFAVKRIDNRKPNAELSEAIERCPIGTQSTRTVCHRQKSRPFSAGGLNDKRSRHREIAILWETVKEF